MCGWKLSRYLSDDFIVKTSTNQISGYGGYDGKTDLATDKFSNNENCYDSKNC